MTALISPYLIPNVSNHSLFRLCGNTSATFFFHCSTFARSVPFSNALIFCRFFMRIRDIGSLLTQSLITTKLKCVFRTKSNIHDAVLLTGFSFKLFSQKVLSEMFDWVLDTSLLHSVSYCLLKLNYWTFLSNIF